MVLDDFKKYDIPDESGVYLFKKGRSILYIGKATSLSDRVRSYFTGDIRHARSPLIEKMVLEANNIVWETTDSVLEALILEANLIKKHQPKYNTKEKDDKSFSYVVITKEDFPRIFIKRGRDLNSLKNIKKIYGPFTSMAMLKEGLKFIRKMFPYRDEKCKDGVCLKAGKSCFNYQIGLCPGVCVNKITKKEYERTIRNISLFFQGKKKKLIEKLTREMNGFAKSEEFEKAKKLRNVIWNLKHINDVSLIKREISEPLHSRTFRIEGYDVAHFAGKDTVGVMTVIEDGEINKKEYRKFNIEGDMGGGDTGSLKEILSRRFEHSEWGSPSIIVVDGGKAQRNTAERFLDSIGLPIPVVAVVKNEKHQPKELRGDENLINSYEDSILKVNSEAHRFAIGFHRSKRKIK